MVSNHRNAAYRSGDGRDWRKINGTAWRQANLGATALVRAELVASLLALAEGVTCNVTSRRGE